MDGRRKPAPDVSRFTPIVEEFLRVLATDYHYAERMVQVANTVALKRANGKRYAESGRLAGRKKNHGRVG